MSEFPKSNKKVTSRYLPSAYQDIACIASKVRNYALENYIKKTGCPQRILKKP